MRRDAIGDRGSTSPRTAASSAASTAPTHAGTPRSACLAIRPPTTGGPTRATRDPARAPRRRRRHPSERCARLRLTVLTVFWCVGRRGDVEAGDAEGARDGVGGAEAFRAPRLDERKRRARVREMRRAQRRRHRLERPGEPRLRVHRVAPSPRGTPASSAFRTARRLPLRRRLRSQRSRRGRARLFPRARDATAARVSSPESEADASESDASSRRAGRRAPRAAARADAAQTSETAPARRLRPARDPARGDARAPQTRSACSPAATRDRARARQRAARAAASPLSPPSTRAPSASPGPRRAPRDWSRRCPRDATRVARPPARPSRPAGPLPERTPRRRGRRLRRAPSSRRRARPPAAEAAAAASARASSAAAASAAMRRRRSLARLRARPGGGAARLRLVPRGVRARRRELREERGDAHGAAATPSPSAGPSLSCARAAEGFPAASSAGARALTLAARTARKRSPDELWRVSVGTRGDGAVSGWRGMAMARAKRKRDALTSARGDREPARGGGSGGGGETSGRHTLERAR